MKDKDLFQNFKLWERRGWDGFGRRNAGPLIGSMTA